MTQVIDSAAINDIITGSGTNVRTPVRVATTTNINISADLAAGNVIDSTTLNSGDRVLVKDQTNTTENGIYVVGLASLSVDSPAGEDISGVVIWVREGTVHTNHGFVGSGVIGTNATFARYDITGVLTTDRGGTGSASFTQDAILVGGGLGPVSIKNTPHLILPDGNFELGGTSAYLELRGISEPLTPAVNAGKLYKKNTVETLFWKPNVIGVEVDLVNTVGGIRHYGALANNPLGIANAGDMYYNTTINQEMRYDASRGKWLSVSVLFEGCGINGNTSPGVFYRRFNGMIMDFNVGPGVPNGTIVAISYGSQTAVNHTFQVLVNGSVVAQLPSGGSNFVYNDTFNVDFSPGIISFRNSPSGSNTTNNLQATIYYKYRT